MSDTPRTDAPEYYVYDETNTWVKAKEINMTANKSSGLAWQPPLIPKFGDGIYVADLVVDPESTIQIIMLVINGVAYEVHNRLRALTLVDEDKITCAIHYKGIKPCPSSQKESESAATTSMSKPTPPTS